MGWLVGWLDRLVGGWVGWLVRFGWFVGWLVDRLIG